MLLPPPPCATSIFQLLVRSAFSARIFSMLHAVLHYTSLSSMLRNTFLILRSDIITVIFSSLLARIFYLSVMFSLCADMPRLFSTCLNSSPLQSDHYPQLCLVWYFWSISALLNSDCSAHATVCLLRYSWMSSLRSALSFAPLGLLISLKITQVTHYLLLAFTITQKSSII